MPGKGGKTADAGEKAGRGSSLRRGSSPPGKRGIKMDAAARRSSSPGKRASIDAAAAKRRSHSAVPVVDRPERSMALELSLVEENTYEALKDTLNVTKGLGRWLGSRAPDGTVCLYLRTKARRDTLILNQVCDCLDQHGCDAVLTSMGEAEVARKGIDRWRLENSGRV